MQKTKGLFLVGPLGGLFIAFQLGLLEFGFSLLILHFCLKNSVVDTLSHLRFNFIIFEILCKNKPQNIKMIAEAKKRQVKNRSGGFFNFCKIYVYGLECFRCVFYDLLSRVYIKLLSSGWYFYWTYNHEPPLLYLVGSESQKIFGVAYDFMLYFVLKINYLISVLFFSPSLDIVLINVE